MKTEMEKSGRPKERVRERERWKKERTRIVFWLVSIGYKFMYIVQLFFDF